MIKTSIGARCSILALTIAGSAQAQEGPAEPGATGLSDIVVTAQRTNQNLQDVPVSVTAIGTEEIARKNINNATDINRVAPNVQFDTGTGGTTSLKPYIRGGGITDGGFVLSESEVAIYVDDIYQPRLSSGSIDMAVLDRIEVLRGPQGVLYGRNASAGAVNFITKGPGADFGGFLEAGYGTWNERRGKGYINAPLDSAGTWRLSASGLVRARDGGAQYNATLDKKVGANSFEGGQADLAYVGSVINARLTGFYNHSKSDGQYPINTVLSSDGTRLVPISGSYRTTLTPVDGYSRTEQYGGRLHLSAEYPGGELRSITGYSEMTEGWLADLSGGVPAAMVPVFLGRPTTAQGLFVREMTSKQWQFSQETQAAGTIADAFDYVAGLYYFHETATQKAVTTTLGARTTLNYQPVTDAFAGYAQGTMHFTDALSLILAGRYTIEDKDLRGGICAGATCTINNVPQLNLRNTFKKFTPKIGVDYKITPDILAYASYSEGFKSGGYNGLAGNNVQLAQAFKPQVTTAYEVGLKTTLFDNTVRLNLAGFWNDIKDRQQTQNNLDGSFLIVNYDMTIKGIEAEVSWLVVPGLTVYGNGALNKGKYTGSSSTNAALLANDPPSLPDYQFTVGADYSVEVGPGNLGIGADFRKTDAYYSTPDNALIGFVQPREILNGYVNYEVGPITVLVSGKNLTNVVKPQTGFGFSVVNPQIAIEPRTVLGTVRYTF
jgi:iron complex outermembrane receptor protein